MVEQGTVLFIFFRLTRTEARRPSKLGPLFFVLGRGSAVLGILVGRGIGGFGCGGRFWWREIILVGCAIVLRNGSVNVVVSGCGDEGFTRSVATPTPFAGRLVSFCR